MILINLLPHREAARKRQKEQFFTQLGLSALLGGVICGGVFVWYQGQISTQQERNSFLQSEIARLDNEIKDIATLQAQIASLRARQTAASAGSRSWITRAKPSAAPRARPCARC